MAGCPSDRHIVRPQGGSERGFLPATYHLPPTWLAFRSRSYGPPSLMHHICLLGLSVFATGMPMAAASHQLSDSDHILPFREEGGEEGAVVANPMAPQPGRWWR